MKFLITVDVEADNQWSKTNSVTVNNIKSLHLLNNLCIKYNFKPTYLLTYEIANNPLCVDIIKGFLNSNDIEIGAHFHPWTTPPFFSKDDRINQRFPSELSEEEVRSKMEKLTNVINKNFGIKPLSFRAGRWGFDKKVAKIISDLGYMVDSSITPKISWKEMLGDLNGNGGPDYRLAQVYPYKIGNLLELPMTILFTGMINKENSKIGNLFLKLNDGLCKRVINKVFFKVRWLRIFYNSKLKDWKLILESARNNNLPAIQFMIHSSELMVGGSPYSKNKESVENILKNIEEMFDFFSRHDLEPALLKDLINNK